MKYYQTTKDIWEAFKLRYDDWDKAPIFDGGELPEWYQKEKNHIQAVLRGDEPIKRILHCGFEKRVVTAEGWCQILKDRAVLKRDFICPDCQQLIKTDFIFMPGLRCITD